MIRKYLGLAGLSCLLWALCACSCMSRISPYHPPPNTQELFLRGTVDLPRGDLSQLYIHLNIFRGAVSFEEARKAPKRYITQSIPLRGYDTRRQPGAISFRLMERQDVSCYEQRDWTLLGFISANGEGLAPQQGEKYSIFHLQLPECDSCAKGSYCRFNYTVKPHLNLNLVTP